MTFDQLELRYDRECVRLEVLRDRGQITPELYDQKIRQLTHWYCSQLQAEFSEPQN